MSFLGFSDKTDTVATIPGSNFSSGLSTRISTGKHRVESSAFNPIVATWPLNLSPPRLSSTISAVLFIEILAMSSSETCATIFILCMSTRVKML